MDAASRTRLWGWNTALDSGFVRGALVSLGIILIVTPLLIWLLNMAGKSDANRQKELWARYRSWLIFIPLMLGPVLLGAGWTIAAICVMSILCYREFSRATGLFRHRSLSFLVVLGIFAITFAIIDHWYGFFVALTPLTVGCIAAVAIFDDQPKGYIQRIAVGIVAFLLFGVCFGHLGYFANDRDFRPILLWLVACVELNDIFAYIVGRTLGRKKLAPNTSPNKTLAGAVGAIVITSAVAAGLGKFVFQHTEVGTTVRLVLLGLILSVTGQLGDLTLSSIKRDLGIKDWANTFPGHGGLLDRFNSLIFASPAVFHFINSFHTIGLDQTHKIFTRV
jgi:phosphatidate cytidylyltransferase